MAQSFPQYLGEQLFQIRALHIFIAAPEVIPRPYKSLGVALGRRQAQQAQSVVAQ